MRDDTSPDRSAEGAVGGSAGDRSDDPDHGRSEVLARLTAQMQQIVTQPPAGSSPARRPVTRGAGAPFDDEPRPVGPTSDRIDSDRIDSDRIGSTVSASSGGPVIPRKAAGAGAPGHPEDDPGHPEAVAKAICLRLLAGAARPRAALAAALRRKGIPVEVAERVLDRLTEVGLIDDASYAQSFVAGRHRHGGLAATALREELRRKGVDADTAASAVTVIDREAEYGRARALLERRVDSAMANGPEAAHRRLLGLLARRGYPADLAQRVVREVIGEYSAEVDGGWS